MMRVRRWIVAGAFGFIALGDVRTAHACSGPLFYSCSGMDVTPAPANAQLIVFRNVFDVSTPAIDRTTEP